MEANENETIIIMNDGDKKEGFFRFGTSKRKTWERMLKRIGGEVNLVEPAKVRMTEGKESWFEGKIPSRLSSNSNFGVRVHTNPRVLSESELEARKNRGFRLSESRRVKS